MIDHQAREIFFIDRTLPLLHFNSNDSTDQQKIKGLK